MINEGKVLRDFHFLVGIQEQGIEECLKKFSGGQMSFLAIRDQNC
jgi:hypothetical protein